MTRARTAAIALLCSAAVAGCSNGAPETTGQALPDPTATTPSTPGAAPSLTADPDVATPLGKGVKVRGGVAVATVYAYKQPAARTAPRPDAQAGYEWGAADVKVCATKASGAGIVVTNAPWALVYANDTQIGASSTGYRQFPEPAYPWGEKSLAPGRCVRGWITFPVPAKKRPVAVEYAPEGEPVAPRWSVK